MLNFEGHFGYDEAKITDSKGNVVGTCVIAINNNVSVFYRQNTIHVGKYDTSDEAVKAAENWIKENIKDNFYPIVDKKVMIPLMDATSIRCILEALVEYVEEVGPRDLRGYENRAKEYIAALPKYDPYEDDEE
jgi:hypothetical protein